MGRKKDCCGKDSRPWKSKKGGAPWCNYRFERKKRPFIRSLGRGGGEKSSVALEKKKTSAQAPPTFSITVGKKKREDPSKARGGEEGARHRRKGFWGRGSFLQEKIRKREKID